MADKTEFLQAIDDAILDADSLEKFINGSDSETVLTRLSAEYPTLQKALKELFENGGIADRFKTLADLQISDLVDGDYALVADDTDEKNGIYIKEGGAWVKSEYDINATSKKISQKAIMEELDNYFSFSTNLFDPSSFDSGVTVSSTGDEQSSSTNGTSDYINVRDNTFVSFQSTQDTAFFGLAAYDADKVFIGRVESGWLGGVGHKVIDLPKGTTYIRVMARTSYYRTGSIVVHLGSDKIPYTPYRPAQLGNVTLSDELVNSVKVDILGDSLRFNTSSVISSYNLYDYTQAIRGHITGLDGQVVESQSGYSTTKLVPIKPNTVYTISGDDNSIPFTSIAFFKNDGTTIITRIDGQKRMVGDNDSYTITTPDGAYFARFNTHIGAPDERERMFTEGSERKPYVDGINTIVNARLGGELVDSIERKPFNLSAPLNQVFDTNKTHSSVRTMFEANSANIYAMYDSLASDSAGYMTTHELGVDGLGNRLAYYKVSQQSPNSPQPNRKPTVFIVCGMHGGEKVSPIACYQLLEQLCTNYRSSLHLRTLRADVNLMILPVANPSGWNTRKRKNHNEVDLNRNFPAGWTAGTVSSNTYGGAEPLSELESKAIVKVFQDNPNIDIFYDFHNFGGVYSTHYIWLPVEKSEFDWTGRLTESFITRMSQKWKADHAFIGDDWIAGYSSYGGTNGTLKSYAKSLGKPIALTFELNSKLWIYEDGEAYDEVHAKLMYEAITNWVCMCIDALSRRPSKYPDKILSAEVEEQED